MPFTWTDPTVIMFAVYLAAMLGIGALGYLGTKNLSDYILGGRSLGSVVTALSAGASDMSGWLLMGLPGAVYQSGLSESWIAIGLIAGAWLNWRLVAGRLRLYTERAGNALTLPDYFAHRFEDENNILRIVTAMVILVFFTVYCASGVVAGARLFENMFGMPYETALWVGALCTIAYVFVGGFLAVSWTDTIQAAMMITALLLAPVIAYLAVQGQLQPGQDWHSLIDADKFDLFKGQTAIGILSLAAWGLGYFGQPHILVRFMAAASVRHIPNARRIGMTWMVLCLGGAVAVGFVGIAYFAVSPAGADAVNANAETVFMELAKQLFNPWIAGALLAAILAAVRFAACPGQRLLADGRAVRAAQRLRLQRRKAVAGALGARAGRKMGAAGLGGRAWQGHDSIAGSEERGILGLRGLAASAVHIKNRSE